MMDLRTAMAEEHRVELKRLEQDLVKLCTRLGFLETAQEAVVDISST